MSGAASKPKRPGTALILWGIVLTIVPMIVGLTASAVSQARAFQKIQSPAAPQPAELAACMQDALLATMIAVPISVCGLILLLVGLVRRFRRPASESPE